MSGDANKPNWIPAELAVVVQGQQYRGTLTDSERAEMIDSARESKGKTYGSTTPKTGIFRALDLLPEVDTKLVRISSPHKFQIIKLTIVFRDPLLLHIFPIRCQ